MGYSYTNALSPRHWFQFADNTALEAAAEEDSQALLNAFTKWCQWTNLHSKCKYFSIKKNGKQSTQFRPYLKLNNEMIPVVKLNDSVVYIEKKFCNNAM